MTFATAGWDENRRSPTEAFRLTRGGALAALLSNLRVPARETPRRVLASDLKVTSIVHVCRGATGEAQVLVCEKWVVSERVTPVTVRGSCPEEETVRVEVTLSPWRIGPKTGGD